MLTYGRQWYSQGVALNIYTVLCIYPVHTQEMK